MSSSAVRPRALGDRYTRLLDSHATGSQDLINCDIYKTDSCTVQNSDATMSAIVQVCIICLDTDSKMFLVRKHKLQEAYEMLTGHLLSDKDNLQPTLCARCIQRLLNYSRFRDMSIRGYSLMMDLLEKHKVITKNQLKTINRAKGELKCNLSSTTLGPDHCDLHVKHKDKQTEPDETVQDFENVVVKIESTHDSMSVDQNLEPVNKDVDMVKSIVADEGYSGTSILVEVKPLNNTVYRQPETVHSTFAEQTDKQNLIKIEQLTIICTNCSQEFLEEHAYNSHVCRNFQHADVGAIHACDTLQVWEPRANPSRDGLAPKLVAPLSARNIETKHTAKELDTGIIQKNKQCASKTNVNTLTKPRKELSDTLEKPKKAGRMTKSRKVTVSSHSQDIDSACAGEEHVSPRGRQSKETSETSYRQTYKGLKRYPCELCNHVCVHKSSLARHMRTHTGEKPFSCNICDYKCAEKGNLVNHVRFHTGEKPFACDTCDYKFATTSALARHKRSHTGEKPFSCNACDYRGALKTALVLHMRSHTGEKPYSCKFCEHKFARKSNLLEHVRTHTGEKPYLCKLCEYKCASSRRLVSHVRTHTGEKPYACEVCKCRFAQKGYLISHMRTHTGDRPYSCTSCEYTCALRTSLVKHMSRKHSD